MRSAIARALAHPSLWLAIIGFSFGNQPTRGESILDHVDIDQYYNFLISDVDRWNGGVEGVEGSIGMGAYEPGFDGLFRVNLDRAFRPINPNGALTLISQSRGC